MTVVRMLVVGVSRLIVICQEYHGGLSKLLWLSRLMAIVVVFFIVVVRRLLVNCV